MINSISKYSKEFQEYIEDLEYQSLVFSFIELSILEVMIQEKSGFLVTSKNNKKQTLY